jgi:type I restriction enzyme S subunit
MLLKRILSERRRRWEEAELAKLKAAGKSPRDEKWKAMYEEPEPPDTKDLPEPPEGWCWASLDQLLTRALANGKSVPDGDGFPVLRLTSIRDGIVDLTQRKSGEWGKIDPLNFAVKPDDFLVVRGNGSINLVGRGARVPSIAARVAFPDTLIRVAIAADALVPALLARWWDSPPIRSHLQRRAKTTAGIYKVNQTDLAETPVPLAPYAEQRRIHDEIERVDSVATESDRELGIAAARCARLRQSILKWAFEGKLVDQDPNDEPAEKLLERIRAERANTEVPKTTRRSRNAQ